jgi:hypothetical protein
MNNIEAVVDALELKVSKALGLIADLRTANMQLEQQYVKAQEEIKHQKQLNLTWEEKYEALKIANAILGSDDNKKETKLKINALIRDIDYCIAQLAN